jgi:anti-anti-sigma factor
LPGIVAFEEMPPVLRCEGEEDAATQPLRRRALSRALCAKEDLVVDLSRLEFADSTLIFDLAILAQRLRAVGRSLLLRDAQPQVVKLIELIGLNRQPGVQLAA